MEPRPRTGPQPLAQLVDQVMAAALAPALAPIAPGSPEARERQRVQSEVERLVQKALWRAERDSRRVPHHVRQSATWVMARRRQIAYELVRALCSRGMGQATANTLAEKACERFPRDGIVFGEATDRADRPRARGDNPRATGTNPRARGKSPRQLQADADHVSGESERAS